MDKGLKKGAVSYVSNIVIGVASTAPAYSLATTLGSVVAVGAVGVHAPAVLLVAFIPMLLVAAAYKYFNRADPDAGTTFAWTTRAIGPLTGWMNGWAIFLADLVVMVSLSDIAAIYTFKLFGFTELGESKVAIIIVAVLWIVLMTWICYRGIELSAKIQAILLGTEVAILGLFSVVAFYKVFANKIPASHAIVENEEGQKALHHYASINPSLSWLNPFSMSSSDLIVALLRRVLHLLGLGLGRGGQRGVRGPGERPRQGGGRLDRSCWS